MWEKQKYLYVCGTVLFCTSGKSVVLTLVVVCLFSVERRQYAMKKVRSTGVALFVALFVALALFTTGAFAQSTQSDTTSKGVTAHTVVSVQAQALRPFGFRRFHRRSFGFRRAGFFRGPRFFRGGRFFRGRRFFHRARFFRGGRFFRSGQVGATAIAVADDAVAIASVGGFGGCGGGCGSWGGFGGCDSFGFDDLFGCW
jgi:hypothetical protein